MLAADAGDAERLGDRPFAWRFRVPRGPIVWDDLFLGRMEIAPSQTGGDFLVARHTVGPSYQLAVVVNDAAMSINQVVRGVDLATSTPRQILLYRSLGCPEPAFGHVPLAVTPDGRRLAKRDGSLKLTTLREAGVDPRILIGSLVFSCGWSEKSVPSQPCEVTEGFEPSRLPREPWIVTEEWLAWLRSQSNR